MKVKTLEKILEIFLGAVVALIPLLIVPLFTDIHDFGKQVFLIFAVFAVCLLWGAKAFLEKKITFNKNRLLLPLLALFLASLISTLVNSPNKMVSLSSATGPASLLLCFLFYLYITNLGKTRTVAYFLMGSGVVVSLVAIILSVKILPLPLNYPSLNLSITESFSPLGSLAATAIFLAVLVPLGFGFAYEKLQEEKNFSAGLIFLANIVILAGLGMAINLLSSTAKPILLSSQTAWNIAVEGLKTGRSALLGVGPGRFMNAFTSLRPLSFNTTPYWNLRFGAAGWYFQLLTETGTLGLLPCLFIVWQIVKKEARLVRQEKLSAAGLTTGLSLIILMILLFFFPLNLSLLLLFFTLLALYEEYLKKEEKTVVDLAPLGSSALLFTIFPILLFGTLIFYGIKLSLANNYFLASLRAAAANDGAKTYDLQIKAIKTDPQSTPYRIAYSQTNFALANSLAAKKDLTDADRNTISQLIQQSLREARAAVSLDTTNVAAWENLANLYRNLINFAQGADQWAVASYQEAVKLDPLNPQLRLDLGGIFYSQKNYRQAIAFFTQAANLKPDFANAHYNLANALKEFGALQDAKQEYEVTLSLVKIDSNDYQKASAELEDVKRKLPAPTPAAPVEPETLSTPQPPAKGIKPPLNLPEEGPPVTEGEEEISPTIQPQP